MTRRCSLHVRMYLSRVASCGSQSFPEAGEDEWLLRVTEAAPRLGTIHRMR